VYAAGKDGNMGLVASLSPCNGSIQATRKVAPAGATSTGFSAISVSGTDIIVGGVATTASDPKEGAWAKLSTTDMSIAWSSLLHGSGNTDEVWSVAVPAGGPVWLAGISNVEGGGSAWGIRGDTTGAACGFPVLSATSNARPATVGPDGVYVAGYSSSGNGGAFVARYSSVACSTSAPCNCQPAWVADGIQVGTAYTEARAIVVVGSTIYIAGFAQDVGASSGDYYAFLSRLNATNGAIYATFTWNPTIYFDSFLGLATDGQTLYGATVAGYDFGSYDTATATVGAFALDFTATSGLLWAVELPFMDVAMGVAADASPAGGVYFAGFTDTAGWVARCTKSGQCP